MTVAGFALGAAGAGAAVGAGFGAVGRAAGLGQTGDGVRLAVLAGLLAMAAAADLARRVPGPRRQVDERWLDGFRGWVYGLGFGVQLGAGLVTVVTSAATFVAFAAAGLSGSILGGLLIGGVYGAGRGVTPALTVRVDNSRRLFALHQRIERWREGVRRGVAAGLTALALAAAGGALL